MPAEAASPANSISKYQPSAKSSGLEHHATEPDRHLPAMIGRLQMLSPADPQLGRRRSRGGASDSRTLVEVDERALNRSL